MQVQPNKSSLRKKKKKEKKEFHTDLEEINLEDIINIWMRFCLHKFSYKGQI